ncbi:hypothetical protein CHS0354_033321 [Potamilus streckersoni]|uniref:Uncharacterized protein n=1 Tax=Potamilus streckersoni TaxID=2493646 RepID=A0AAE0RTF3_9BIVA|nr:hypothetical protein CHS0354_033321 [Potamilus streckersoni]
MLSPVNARNINERIGVSNILLKDTTRITNSNNPKDTTLVYFKKDIEWLNQKYNMKTAFANSSELLFK